MLSFILGVLGPEEQDKVIYLNDTYRQSMLNYASFLLSTKYIDKRRSLKEDTEDIVSDTLTALFVNIEKIDFSRTEEEIRAYVLNALDHKIFNFYFKGDQHESLEALEIDIASDEDMDEYLAIVNENDLIKQAILELPEPYKSTMYLRYLNNLSVKDIALLEERTQSAIYSRLHEGKELLRLSLKKKGIIVK